MLGLKIALNRLRFVALDNGSAEERQYFLGV